MDEARLGRDAIYVLTVHTVLYSTVVIISRQTND